MPPTLTHHEPDGDFDRKKSGGPVIVIMPADNLLKWRPKTDSWTTVSAPELLWTMHKNQWQIDCALQNCGRNGWSVHVHLDGHPFFRCLFRSWEDAVESAEDKYAELVNGGWTPVPLKADDRYGW